MQTKQHNASKKIQRQQARVRKDIWCTKVFQQKAHATTKIIALRIASYYNLEHMAAWPSQQRLAKDLALSERQVRRGVAYLKLHGWLKVTPRRHDPTAKQRTNLYQLAFAFTPQQLPLKPKPAQPSQPTEQ